MREYDRGAPCWPEEDTTAETLMIRHINGAGLTFPVAYVWLFGVWIHPFATVLY